MAQVRYLGIAVGEPVEPASLRSDPKLGLFVPAAEPLPVGTQVDFDEASVVVLRVEEGAAPGFWLRANAVPRLNTDDVTTARNIELPTEPASAAEPAKPAGDTADGDRPDDKPDGDKSDGDKSDGDKPDGGERKRRRRAKTSVGR